MLYVLSYCHYLQRMLSKYIRTFNVRAQIFSGIPRIVPIEPRTVYALNIRCTNCV